MERQSGLERQPGLSGFLQRGESYLVPPNIVIKGHSALVDHFLETGIIRRHRGRYWKHKLTAEATMVFTTKSQAAWFLVRSRRAKPLSEQWAKILE